MDNEVDFARLGMLLVLAEKLVGHPKLVTLRAIVQLELDAMEEEVKPVHVAAPVKETKSQAIPEQQERRV